MTACSRPRQRTGQTLRLSPLLACWLSLALAVAITGCASSKSAHGSQPTNAPPQPYMRVARPDSNTVALQIALRSFAPPKGRGPVVWLSGASHIGESNYFAALQRHLDAQALVLFEGVGAKDKKVRFDPNEEVSIQHTMAESLGLVFQLGAINYDRAHFRNSDLTIPQLQQLLAGGTATNRTDRGGRSTGTGEEFQQLLQIMDGSSFLGTLLHAGLKLIGSSPKLQALTKVMLIEILGQLKGDMAQLKGVPPEIQRLLEVIIRERNKVVFDDLKKELRAAGPPRSVSVFYGAGHMADLERRLRDELHYRPLDEVWLTALAVNPRAAGLSSLETEMMRGLIQWQMEALRP
jgi:hypothetical protein